MKKAIVIGVYVLSLVILLSLSVWQLQRGNNKAQLERRYAQGQIDPVFITGQQLNSSAKYQRVRLKGYWQYQNSFLLQNRVYQGQVGIEVLTPFQPIEGDTFIVNRGWVSNNEFSLLSFIANGDKANVVGTVYKPSKGVTIGEAIIETGTWPLQSLYFDLASFSQQLEQPIAQKALVLDESHPAAYKKIWLPVSMSSTKHYGYAVQWLGLAITFIVFGFIWFRHSFKK